MKLEKRDVAEALGLVYKDIDTRGYYDYHVFWFYNKEILIGTYIDLEDAWEEAANKVLEPLVGLLKERL